MSSETSDSNVIEELRPFIGIPVQEIDIHALLNVFEKLSIIANNKSTEIEKLSSIFVTNPNLKGLNGIMQSSDEITEISFKAREVFRIVNTYLEECSNRMTLAVKTAQNRLDPFLKSPKQTVGLLDPLYTVPARLHEAVLEDMKEQLPKNELVHTKTDRNNRRTLFADVRNIYNLYQGYQKLPPAFLVEEFKYLVREADGSFIAGRQEDEAQPEFDARPAPGQQQVQPKKKSKEIRQERKAAEKAAASTLTDD